MLNWNPPLIVWLAAALIMTLVWWRQIKSQNAGFVDVAWAALLGVAAIYYFFASHGALASRVAVSAIAAIWGLRLAWHLYRRVSHEPEDGRYRFLREHWQNNQGNFFVFFMAQATLVFLFSLPFWIAINHPAPAMWQLLLGVVIWLTAMFGESIADAQLAAHRNDPSNRGITCRRGLWAYSRHPNYFFEWLHWFAYAVMALGAPHAWVALIGPIVMWISLMWLTGIPYTEAQALRSRGEDYQRYQREVSVMIPWWPKR